MRKTVSFLCSVILASGLMIAAAQAKEYKCPEQISVAPGQVAAPADFEGWSDPQVKFFVTGIDVYEGHPNEKAQLKPDNADDPNEADGSVWTLPASAKGFWMVCLYSDTNARVTRQLDPHETYCAMKDVRGPEDNTAMSGDVSLACH